MALRAMWQSMDRDVTHKIVYGPRRQTGPLTAIWTEVPSTICYINFLYSILVNLSDGMFFVIVYLRPKTSSDKIRKKTLY